MLIHGFKLENELKIKRVYDKIGDSNPDQFLAEYDAIAGLITDRGLKVRTGTFWDSRAKAPQKEIKPVYVRRFEGKVYHTPEEKMRFAENREDVTTLGETPIAPEPVELEDFDIPDEADLVTPTKEKKSALADGQPGAPKKRAKKQ